MLLFSSSRCLWYNWIFLSVLWEIDIRFYNILINRWLKIFSALRYLWILYQWGLIIRINLLNEPFLFYWPKINFSGISLHGFIFLSLSDNWKWCVTTILLSINTWSLFYVSIRLVLIFGRLSLLICFYNFRRWSHSIERC